MQRRCRGLLFFAVFHRLLDTLQVEAIFAFLFRLALHLFHEKIAFRAALLLCFMPSMIVWNSVAIKDPVMVLLVTDVMDLGAMGMVATAITVERLAPRSETAARASRVIVVAAGAHYEDLGRAFA